jgi:hypothetical protein
MVVALLQALEAEAQQALMVTGVVALMRQAMQLAVGAAPEDQEEDLQTTEMVALMEVPLLLIQ